MTRTRYRLAENPQLDLDVEETVLADGTRLTPEIAAEIAEEALVKSRVGRPSLGHAGQRSPAISFRVSEDVREAVEQLAASTGTTVSQIARAALESYVARH